LIQKDYRDGVSKKEKFSVLPFIRKNRDRERLGGQISSARQKNSLKLSKLNKKEKNYFASFILTFTTFALAL